MNTKRNGPNIANSELLDTYYKFISEKLVEKFPMGYLKETDTGVFIPSSLNIIRKAFTYLIAKGVIDQNKPLLDAGCGDGRIVALASSMGISAWGIESDEELTALAKHNLINLRAMRVIGESQAIIHHGDFCDSKTYKKLDMEFSDFGTVYNYYNNAGSLANKIVREAKPRTIFILYSGDEVKEKFCGLILLHELNLVNDSNSTLVNLEVPQGFVRVYVKE